MDSYLTLFRATLRAEKSNSETDELNFIDKTSTEKCHLGLCKSTQGVKKSSTNLAVRTELGRLPLESLIKTQILYVFSDLTKITSTHVQKRYFI